MRCRYKHIHNTHALIEVGLSHLSEPINTDKQRMHIKFKAALTERTDPILKDSRNAFRIIRQDGLNIATQCNFR